MHYPVRHRGLESCAPYPRIVCDKERLEESGVSYADFLSGVDNASVALYDPNQGARIRKFEITDKIANDFFMMFCRGRKDVYELRYTNPRTGKLVIIHNALTVGIKAAICRKKTGFGAEIVN